MAFARQFVRADWRCFLSEISAREYIEWSGHFRRFPFDYHLRQFEMGQICAAIYNTAFRPQDPIQLTQFLYNQPADPEPVERSDDELMMLSGSVPGVERVDVINECS